MARLIVTSFVLVAVTLAAAAVVVEGREVVTVRANRKFIGDAPVLTLPVDGTKSINASSDASGRMLTGEDECQRTCDHVKFKSICRSLTKLPGVTTPEALLHAAVRVALVKATQAKRRVDAYAASYHGGNPLASMLESCSHGYGNVVDSLAEAQHAIDAGHATGADLNRQLSTVTTDAMDCNNAFDERPEIPSPFPGTIKNVYRVVDNVLNIAYLVKHP
ncbi:hypothetical protein QOZ80_5BG0412680 [Eleusine coracana subsp. coracana]|nr:hypothetical protein QOZ80_5BG0412680 [Eleusine coracana subsp. coracana]